MGPEALIVSMVEPTRRERQRADTRAELLAAAHELVRNEGYDGLTIRKLAEKVGYAPMSVYSYFSDKQAILEAVAQDTFEKLAKYVDGHESGDPMVALRHGLMEYAAFGMDNANEYRTIFMTEKAHEHSDEKFEELRRTNPAYAGLLRCVEEGIAAGHLKGDAEAIATILWTVVHGAISLMLTFRKFPFGEPMKYVGTIVDLTLAGLKDREVGPLADGRPAMC